MDKTNIERPPNLSEAFQKINPNNKSTLIFKLS